MVLKTPIRNDSMCVKVCTCMCVCVFRGRTGCRAGGVRVLSVKMVSDSGSCWCLFCDAGLFLLAQHSAKASLAAPSQQNNKHVSQAKSFCQVLNGVEYTSWRPAEALALGGGITNTKSLELRLIWSWRSGNGKGSGGPHYGGKENVYFLSGWGVWQAGRI